MGTEKLTADIKTRVPVGVKRAIEQIARDRHLDMSDIAREAFREFLKANKNLLPEPDNTKEAA